MEYDVRRLIAEVTNSVDFLDAVQSISERNAREVEFTLRDDLNLAISSKTDFEDVRQIAELTLRSQIKSAVLEVLRDIGLVDDNFSAHEPREVKSSDFIEVVLQPFE